MTIHSKIAETGTVICNLDLNENSSEVDALRQEQIMIEMGDYGEVVVSRIIAPGMCILETKFSLEKKVTDHFNVKGEHIQIHLAFEGNCQVKGIVVNGVLQIDNGFGRVSFQKQTNLQAVMSPVEDVRFLSIFMTRDYYLGLLKNETWTQGDVFYQDIMSRRYLKLNHGAFVIKHQTLALIAQIFDKDHPGAHYPHRMTFVDMKLKEMFFLFHMQYRYENAALHNFDTETLSALQKAKAILTANAYNALTIKELSRHVSLNEQKLKQGFKALFNTTIHGYVFDIRMKEARRLVLNPNYSINQISEELGYKSTSHFISAFKKFYGQTPKQSAMHKMSLTK